MKIFLALLAFPLACFAQAPSLPVFPAKNVPETFFGTRVDDPYRAMENEKDPTVAAWMKAHADHARKILDSLKGYAPMKARIAELDSGASARIGGVNRVMGATFYTRRGATENVFKLYVRPDNGQERLLADPDEFEKKTGKPHAINYFQPSRDGKLVAVGISPAGNELASLYIYETETGKLIEGPIDRARYSQPSWTPDSKAFFYTRVPKIPEGAPVSELFKNTRAYFHTLGTDADKDDLYLLGPDAKANAKVPVAPTEFPYVSYETGSKYAIAQVIDGVRRELQIYAAPFEAAARGDANWIKLVGYDDKVTGYAVHGDDIYLLTHAQSPRFAVKRMSLAAPTMARAETVVPAGTEVIENISAARDALYFDTREGALKRGKRLAWGSKRVEDVKFPVQGAVNIYSTRADLDGAIVGVTAWTQALQIYAVARDGRVTNTGLQPLGKYDAPPDLVAIEVKARSHDGAMVPLSIVHKKGVKLDGSNPALLVGYGAYGITYDANFDPVRYSFLEQGGVYAVANVRGSSAYGEDWYKAGYKTTKPNTWKDFIACAEYLIANKYTSSAHLGIAGGSAGGITIGRSLTERPDLFAAAVPQVGMLDFVRLHVMPIGPVNVPEFGDIREEEGFRALLAMSSYHHVKEGTKYPAVLLQHGVNDTRVNVGQSNKMAARLMAATTSGKPILLDLDYDSGHGQGMTKAQRYVVLADLYAFVLWQAGHPGFQPK